MEVHNWELKVCQIDIGTVSASSSLIIGDSQHIQLYGYFDTPPDSYVVLNSPNRDD
ncbi:hypothetical protein SAMN04488134_10863 [Amphibacillus marinus]|uniref:Spore germination protein PD n=1 Tax=Amphibacillus marinus TaxID=872970 RepID=A0A1H8Q7I8_9BACI|nr:spore gernimation protein GerPD [Amphibacillus marinus]SEO49941.1 hypothetical protein SAMN04488134_10863 [Amphibacillus marinus]